MRLPNLTDWRVRPLLFLSFSRVSSLCLAARASLYSLKLDPAIVPFGRQIWVRTSEHSLSLVFFHLPSLFPHPDWTNFDLNLSYTPAQSSAIHMSPRRLISHPVPGTSLQNRLHPFFRLVIGRGGRIPRAKLKSLWFLPMRAQRVPFSYCTCTPVCNKLVYGNITPTHRKKKTAAGATLPPRPLFQPSEWNTKKTENMIKQCADGTPDNDDRGYR